MLHCEDANAALAHKYQVSVKHDVSEISDTHVHKGCEFSYVFIYIVIFPLLLVIFNFIVSHLYTVDKYSIQCTVLPDEEQGLLAWEEIAKMADTLMPLIWMAFRRPVVSLTRQLLIPEINRI